MLRLGIAMDGREARPGTRSPDFASAESAVPFSAQMLLISFKESFRAPFPRGRKQAIFQTAFASEPDRRTCSYWKHMGGDRFVKSLQLAQRPGRRRRHRQCGRAH